MPLRVHVEPSLLRWATTRSGTGRELIETRFPRFGSWVSGEADPTLKQLEAFARATATPVGLLLLPSPPDMPLPVPDFRTVPGVEGRPPSPDLLDTIYLCEERQEWYRRYSLINDLEPLDVVASATMEDGVEQTAGRIRRRLAFDVDARREYGSWAEALGRLAELAEGAGILVMMSGVVGSNTRRKLDPDEFRGFALVDDRAPVVFVNASDTKAAQVFTLAHELVHVWLGQPGVSNPRLDRRRDDQRVERFCNEVAAEFLVPLDDLRTRFDPSAPLSDELGSLARLYRVSTLVVLRQIHAIHALTWDEYRSAYSDELTRHTRPPRSSGGNFYNTQPIRTSRRFARAVISEALEGRTLHRDAFRLLGVRKYETFRELGHRLGVP